MPPPQFPPVAVTKHDKRHADQASNKKTFEVNETEAQVDKSSFTDNGEIEKVPEGTIPTKDEVAEVIAELGTITPHMRRKIAGIYGRKVVDDDLVPTAADAYILDKIMSMSLADALEILRRSSKITRETRTSQGRPWQESSLCFKGLLHKVWKQMTTTSMSRLKLPSYTITALIQRCGR
ncbi:hypothetical protein MRB53_041901 [Persea americana]|nr:hypothetical protein MRB53_041901 [Persea americana]